MLYCIESLGKRYKENDEAFILFEKVLAGYLQFINEESLIKVNEEHTNYFFELEFLYKASKGVPSDNWNAEERMADALMFYKAIGLIILKDGEYYINSDALKNKYLEYEAYKEKKNAVVYSKGPKK